MSDRFDSYAALAAVLTEGEDYRIRCVDRGAATVILAPHGGTIEPGTAEIAEAIAGNAHSFYAFEALKPGRHGDLHVTSHRFDEPRARALLARADRAAAVHGRRDDGTETVWLGGRDAGLRDSIGRALRAAGFEADLNDRLPGLHPRNICNRTRDGQGVQLELPRSLRRRLEGDSQTMTRFAAAVRRGLADGMA